MKPSHFALRNKGHRLRDVDGDRWLAECGLAAPYETVEWGGSYFPDAWKICGICGANEPDSEPLTQIAALRKERRERKAVAAQPQPRRVFIRAKRSKGAVRAPAKVDGGYRPPRIRVFSGGLPGLGRRSR